MFLDEWMTKPRNDYIVLLGISGDVSKERTDTYRYTNSTTDEITTALCCVYNVDSDRVSDKAVYKDSKGRLYIKCGKCGYGSPQQRMYLDDFE